MYLSLGPRATCINVQLENSLAATSVANNSASCVCENFPPFLMNDPADDRFCVNGFMARECGYADLGSTMKLQCDLGKIKEVSKSNICAFY